MLEKDYGFTSEKLDAVLEKPLGEMTEDESKIFFTYSTELAAHETEIALGNEQFIDRIVMEDEGTARKLVGKLLTLDKAFSSLKDKNARAQAKLIKEAEKLYLKAAENSGNAYIKKMILAHRPELEEELERVQMSYAGPKARTADRIRLENARAMLENGTDAETIRKETGWFKGYDGKWRFEIDDSNMTLKETDSKYITLGDLIEHDSLFEAYPQLADLPVTFSDLGNKQGSYVSSWGEINLNNSIKSDPAQLKGTLVHEIQHAIQDIEGFARGASVEHWEKKLLEGFDSRQDFAKKQEQEALDRIKALRLEDANNDTSFVDDMELLESMRPDHPRGKVDWDTFEQIEEDSAEWKAFDRRRDKYAEEYGEAKVFEYLSIASRLERLKTTGNRDATALYLDTAGEIEARDTAKRLGYDMTQRKNTRPDVDQEDVVFAEGNDRSYDIAIDNHNHKVVVIYKDILANKTQKPHQIIANEIANHMGEYYTIFESGQNVYIGEDLPGEYTQSVYMQAILKNRLRLLNAKNQAVQGLGEMIEIATNRK